MKQKKRVERRELTREAAVSSIKSSEFGVGQNWAPDACLDLLCYKPLGMLLKIKNVGGDRKSGV